MGLFGKSLIIEFEGREPGYYFQVFVTRPKENRVPVTVTRMWETEKDALKDLSFIVPTLIMKDPSDPDNLIFKDSTILNKNIYIAKIEKPDRVDNRYAKIEDIEYDTIKRYLDRNGIMYRVKLKNTQIVTSRSRIVQIAIMDIKNSLKDTEFTKKCIRYNFKEDDISYDRFTSGISDSLTLANYSTYSGIPNPKNNTKMLDVFYSELHDAINEANRDINRFGYKLELSGGWDMGIIYIESISSIFDESQMIYEDPTNLKIDGQPADDENTEEDDNTNYSIQSEPDEEETTDQPEEPPQEDPEPDQEEDPEPVEDDNPEGTTEDEETADYRIPDTAEDDTEEETTQDDNVDTAEDQGGEESATDDGEEGNVDTTEDDEESTDYRVNAGSDEEKPSEDNSTEGEATDDNVETGDEETSEDENKETEDEIFSDMNPEQRRIQDEELKENYIRLYNTIGDLINRLDQVSVNNFTREPMDFVQKQLIDMKDFVFKYLSEVYSTKTYIENNINYQQYLVILSNINNLLVQLNTKSSDIE